MENLRPDLKRLQFSIPNTISGSVDATKKRSTRVDITSVFMRNIRCTVLYEMYEIYDISYDM